MKFKTILVLLSVVQAVWCSDIAGVKTSEKFDHSVLLDTDRNYILFWNFNDTHVTFEVHVRTKGWVGFGFSGNGNMYPGDVVVGWVKDDGSVHFADRHTVGHRMPVIDKSQDWKLLFGEENEFGTVLKFIRKINTCDDAEDEVIQEGTNRIIFAYGEHDPADDNSINYHGTTRGTKSVALLSPNPVNDNLPADSRHFDFLNANYLVPSDTTTYWCRGFKMPPIGKHHMIKYEAVVTEGNELNVHHILLYRCNVDNPDHWDGKEGICYHQHRTLPQCSNIIIAWAIGGEPFYFPDHVGFSIGGPEDEAFYIMETHYDNPTRKSDMIDDSGIRITITPTLRPQEAGMLELGHVVSYFQVVPPGINNFVTKSYCSSQCLSQGFTQSNLTEVKIIGALQHSHLLGVAMKTRHYRNGVELKPLMTDPHYDFDFQEVRMLPKEVPVYPGDSFQVDCTYDSTSRSTVTEGGLSTREEMCLTFAYYYPKMKVANCLSQPTYDNFPFDYHQLNHIIHTVDWHNKTVVDFFLSHIDKSSVYEVCDGPHLKPHPYHVYKPSEPAHPYVPPQPDCS
ncbi:DBH-like monooxygenase protein 1 homolog [Mercenaria mercenaria]|uniref:DBH-like monooxygenase protein 1 homolog n=1 Tax=Mercenaria mercenaria TaxID=6596 RepID=UPI00234F3240|nr:DBH-like monooxygenase protein 1 homolog [Mercenaria mercenaria]